MESAQALRPVDGPNAARDPRLHTAHDRPAGPPPSFDISVLEDLRARLVEPPDPADPPGGDGGGKYSDHAGRAVADGGNGQRETAFPERAVGSGLDKKV